MKIDKIVFSCSEPPAYSSFWNRQSWLWKTKLGIEPICLLYGKRSQTDMSEEHGRVIEMQTIEGLPWSFQMVWSKFDFTRSEPDTTWIIGDVDLLPLQRRHFTDRIVAIPDNAYACLNAAGISNPRIGMDDGFERLGSERHGKDGGFIGSDIPAHYHVAKGALFERLYFDGRTFEESVRELVESNRWGMGVLNNYGDEKRRTDPYWYYWCGEENFTSYTLWNAMRAGEVAYYPVTYHNTIERILAWDKERADYRYDSALVRAGRVVDIHCCQARPYAVQAEALERIIALSGGWN